MGELIYRNHLIAKASDSINAMLFNSYETIISRNALSLSLNTEESSMHSQSVRDESGKVVVTKNYGDGGDTNVTVNGGLFAGTNKNNHGVSVRECISRHDEGSLTVRAYLILLQQANRNLNAIVSHTCTQFSQISAGFDFKHAVQLTGIQAQCKYTK